MQKLLAAFALTTSVCAAPAVRITPEGCKQHGLPPVAFHLGAVPSHFIPSTYEHGWYVLLSGPPGGPHSVVIAPSKAKDATELEAQMRNSNAGQSGFQAGTASHLKVLGATRPTWSWAEGKSLTRSFHLAILVAPTTRATHRGLVVEIISNAGEQPVTAGTDTYTGDFKSVVDSLRFDS